MRHPERSEGSKGIGAVVSGGARPLGFFAALRTTGWWFVHGFPISLNLTEHEN
jgi:hypothetical protein